MYFITTKKESGIISGVQLKDNGPIDWSQNLPPECRLSSGLKKILTPLLAGVLEANQKLIWGFDRFFTEVTDILSRKIVHIFHTNAVTSLRAYVHPDETYEQLQNYIKEQTDIQPESQIVLYKNELFCKFIGESTRAQGYPTFDENNPLLLFSKENFNVSVSLDGDLPKFPEFPNLVSVESDAAQAKQSCSIGHVCKRRIEKASRSTELIQKAVTSFSSYLMEELRQINFLCEHLCEMTQSREESTKILEIAGKVQFCCKVKSIEKCYSSVI